MGADLLIAAVDARGTVRMPIPLGIALAAAELVDLAGARRIEAVDGRVRVTDRAPTGDPVLDDTLHRLAAQPKGPGIDGWIARNAADRVHAHIAALLASGQLSGQLVSVRLDAAPQPLGLRVAAPDRRGALAERLARAGRAEAALEQQAFGVLCYVADLPAHLLSGRTRHRTAKPLKTLADRFADTWRYLPGCPQELALGDPDVAPGSLNPAHDEPWRLLIRLAVQAAVTSAQAETRESMRENGLSQDVRTAANLAYTLENRL